LVRVLDIQLDSSESDADRAPQVTRRCTVLKKAGLVVATVTVGMIAVSPLAFAGDKGDKSHDAHRSNHNDHSYSVSEDNDYDARVDNSVEREQHNDCDFIQNQEGAFETPLLGALPLLGGQTQALNCTNFGDVTVADLDGDDADVALTSGA
jgi:hypothetical protein